jgi:hypothetical protein
MVSSNHLEGKNSHGVVRILWTGSVTRDTAMDVMKIHLFEV